jgi:hypothetical protein
VASTEGRSAFAGEPTDLDAPKLALRIELRPVGEASGYRVKEPMQAMRRTVVDIDLSQGGHHAALVSPVHVTPITG